MGRGLLSSVNAIIRENERQAKARQREIAREQREQLKIQREYEKHLAISERNAKIDYQSTRAIEVEILNQNIQDRLNSFQEILPNTVNHPFNFDLNSITAIQEIRNSKPPKDLVTPSAKPAVEAYMHNIPVFNKLQLLLPGNRKVLEEKTKAAQSAYAEALRNYESAEIERLNKLEVFENQKSSKVEQLKTLILSLREEYESGVTEQLPDYFSFILDQYEFIPEFLNTYKLGYVSESKELVIEYKLPDSDIVPEFIEYRYVKSRDAIETRARKKAEISSTYTDLVSALCLSLIFAIFKADSVNLVNLITLNGYVETIDLATGKDIRPYILSVRTTKEEFAEIDLLRVDTKTCLRNLGALVSAKPSEKQPIRPIVNFEMVDKRFVEQSDILDEIDNRPNLMELNPYEFENLVSNLFTRMGLETKQTRSTKDGGVDAVAYDPRPVLGGKVVIQAKRYKDVVGVAFVRDLYGTMINEGANKGILVSTSGYGPDAFEFSKDKPIELIDGGGLLYLLRQVGIEARIIHYS